MLRNLKTAQSTGTRPTRGGRLQFQQLEPRLVLDGNTLVISELMADNETTLADGDGDYEDWIEIHNPTANPVDLGGWYLTDRVEVPTLWQFPATPIGSGEYVLVFASSKHPNGPAGELHTNFKLSNNGEYLALVRPDGTTIEHAYAPEFPRQYDDVSYGLSADLAAQGYFLAPTPETANVGQPVDDPTERVIINEIMYHPTSEDVLEEYIELYNGGIFTVDLSDWRLSDGVDYTFPPEANATLAPGEYLVVAADLETFGAVYSVPPGTTVVGGWTGKLSNSSEEIELDNALGDRVDRVTYADEGDWSVRLRTPLDHEHEGWAWADDHDGGGKTLELINPAMSNRDGQNWAASIPDGGTPGAANSAAAADIAPVIVDVGHLPIIPGPADPVTVTARLKDELATGLAATVYYRDDGAAVFETAAMLDDGLSGDGAAGDGVFGAELPARPHGAIVEFYVQATDAGANVRTWPAPTQPSGEQLANLLYQVDDAFDPAAEWVPGSQPVYYMIMTEAERAELQDIGDDGNEFCGEGRSDAQMNATFITVDGTETELHYNAGIRNRGNRSRVDPPNNYRVNIPHDRPWKEVTAINVNSKQAFDQVIGSAIYRMAGTAAPDATPVEVRVNGQNLADNDAGMYGLYAAVEVYGSDYARHHFPEDPDGNLYRVAYMQPCPSGTRTFGDLNYKGPAPYDDPDYYRENYLKRTNEGDDQWTDLLTLIDKLNNPAISDDDFAEQVRQVVDLEQWMRYMATDFLVGNGEGGLITGSGDDFAMYAGTDGRFKLLPHDLDTMFSTRITDIWNFEDIRGLRRLMGHPEVQNLYLSQHLELIGTIFAPENFNPMVDEILNGVAPQSVIDSMKQFVVNRTNVVLAQIPQEFTINSNLPVVDGFPRTNQPQAQLDGTAQAAYTASVLVDGLVADFSPRDGNNNSTWSIGEGAAPTTFSFQDGVSPDAGYAGTTDTMLAAGNADNDYGSAVVFHIDTDAGIYGGGPTHSLVRFDGIFGDGPGQIASEAHISSATLVLDVDNTGHRVDLHRMLMSWNESDTWNILVDGIQADDVEAAAAADASTNPGGGSVSVDVTASLQAWQADPDTNHGWAILPTGNDGAAFSSREVVAVANRPRLNVTLTESPVTNGVPLDPGVNRLLVEAFDGPEGTGNLVDSGYVDVWYDPAKSAAGQPAGQTAGQTAGQADKQQQLEMVVRDSYLPGVPMLVRVEALDDAGNVDRDLWDAVVTLSTDRPGEIGLSIDQITLINGLGSALVTASGSGDFTLTTTLDALQSSRTITSLEGQPITDVSGELPGAETTFSGIVHVTGDLLVPADHTLTVEPGTLVLIDGVPTGEDGVDIDVQGNIQSLGTAEQPVTFTAFYSMMPWGEIHHADADPSLYQYTNITRAGNSPGGGHTGAGPMIRPVGSTIVFDHASVTDAGDDGKIMQSTAGSDLTFLNAHLARAIMGPEIDNTALLMEDTWITEMYGPDDSDGIYIHSQRAGQVCAMRRGVIADVHDDGLDTLESVVTVEDYIFRNATDKGVSVFGAETTIIRAMMIDNDIGISQKERGTDTSRVNLDHVTIVGNRIGIEANDKYGEPDVMLEYSINNAIVWGNTELFRTDYDPAGPHLDIRIDYSNLQEAWTLPGVGNLSQDPTFVDDAADNYRLQEGSPSIDAGDPGSQLDPDGTWPDQGYFVGNPGGTLVPGVIVGTISQDVILTPEAGPWQVVGHAVVDTGVTMTILPGTTVFFGRGTSLTIQGRLLAEGTKYQQIRLTSLPGTDDWDGLRLLDTMEDNRISYAVIEGCHRSAGMIDLDNANLTVDHVTFDNALRRRIATTNSSLIVRNSVFTGFVFPGRVPDNVAEHIWGVGPSDPGGHFIIQNNVFGLTIGHNDALDVDGYHRPAPVLQVLDNLFLGSGDDALDFEGDAHIEGNVFMHVRKDQYNTGSGNANVISAGDRHDVGHDYVMVRNVFYDVDQVAQVKQNAFMTFVDNTVVGAEFAALYFVRPTGGTPGRGAYLDGNVFVDTPVLFDDVRPETVLTVHRSLFDAAPVGTDVTALGEGNLFGDARLADPDGGDFSLLPGSAALGTGPNGVDMGAMIPAGVSIWGEPAVLSPQTGATLTIGPPGVGEPYYSVYSHYKYRLGDGPFSEETPIDTPVELTGLADGQHTLYAIGKNSAGVWQDEAQATASKTWTVDSSLARLRVNEVLAINVSAVDHYGTFPDLIELVNDGALEMDLAGMGITDDRADPAKFVFPADTVLAPGELLVLLADDRSDTPGLHLGFALDGDGEGVYLFAAGATAGDDPIDSVEFGPQVADFSIGRVGQDGHWALTQPTFATGKAPAAANLAQPTGDPATLRINEWLVDGEVLFGDDFLELYNPDPLPVALGGLYLTDRPIGSPGKHQIAALSFVAGSGYAVFTADGDPQDGPSHLDFRFSRDQELIGLFDAELHEIDKLIYYPQTTDVSQGRDPDGAAQFQFFPLPTPGVPNVDTVAVGAIALDAEWEYDQSGADLGTEWREVGYLPDPAWPTGPGVLALENDPLPSPAVINTPLELGNITYYFRTHFNVDADPQDVSLELTGLIDDGAVIYLNGREVLRPGMPEGDIDYQTRANRGGDAFFDGPHPISTEFLEQGDNLLAVEVHQTSSGSSDIVFGLTLDATIVSGVALRAAELIDGLRITEIMYHPADDQDAEFIELTNVGDSDLDLTGVRLSGGIEFTFPPLWLPPNEYVVVVRDLEAFETRYGAGINVAGQYSDNLSDGGEDVLLQLPAPFDAAVLRVDYNDAWYPTTDGAGFALEIRDPAGDPAGWDQASSWRAGTVDGGTPASDLGPPVRNIIINEVLTHTDEPLTDYIELYNPTGDDINVGGWYLSDSRNNLRKFRIPDGTTITGGDYLVFDELDFNPMPPQPGPNDFALDGAHGDDVWLAEANQQGHAVRVADHVEFGAAAAGEPFGRWPNGSGPLYPMTGPTPGVLNSGPRVGPMIISELHYHPDHPNATDMEFVEIYNSGPFGEDLANWRLRGGVDFDFPAGVDLLPYATLVVVPFDLDDAARLAAFRAEYGIDDTVTLLGGYSGQLSNTAEEVRLQRPDDPPAGEPWFIPRLLEDQVTYRDDDPWPTSADGGGASLNRTETDAWGNVYTSFNAAAPTPGQVGFDEPDTYVVARHVFYNNSVFDGDDPAANAQDDDAIAPDKQALLPGGTATFANYTSYARGLNGIMIDVHGLPQAADLQADDFTFLLGNTNDPGSWTAAAAPAVTVRPGQGRAGSDRITLIWPDNVIQKQWLQVTVLSTADTGLDAADVFYYGNAIGECGNSTTDAKVNAVDMLGARDNQRNFLDPAEIDFAYDFNRDARVNSTDMLIARNNQTHFLNALGLITVPGPKAAAASAPDVTGAAAHDAVLAPSAQRDASAAGFDWLSQLDARATSARPAQDKQAAEPAIHTLPAGLES